MTRKPSQRLLALDIMRGITIAGMILVNNSGSWAPAYEPLRHAEWNGLTPTDLVFPFFMFIMGVSTYLSLRKTEFHASWPVVWKIIKRAILIFVVGLGLAWLGMFLKGMLVSGKTLYEATMTFDTIRIPGVLTRLALCYGIAGVIAVTVKHRWLPWIVGISLALYAVVMVVGHGYEYSEANILGIIDRALVGEKHMYISHAFDTELAFDPEGLAATLPSVAHVLIGFICGGLIVSSTDRSRQLNRLFIVGGILTFAGLLLSYGLPLNKRVWSPTFVLTTCGMAATLLGLLIWAIDVRGWKRWTGFFHAFGINPLYLYVQSIVLYYVCSYVRIACEAAPDGVTSLKGALYYTMLDPLSGNDPQLASCIWGISFVIVNWIPGYLLQRRGIIIKL